MGGGSVCNKVGVGGAGWGCGICKGLTRCVLSVCVAWSGERWGGRWVGVGWWVGVVRRGGGRRGRGGGGGEGLGGGAG